MSAYVLMHGFKEIKGGSLQGIKVEVPETINGR